jgi:hypothetical protein
MMALVVMSEAPYVPQETKGRYKVRHKRVQFGVQMIWAASGVRKVPNENGEILGDLLTSPS